MTAKKLRLTGTGEGPTIRFGDKVEPTQQLFHRFDNSAPPVPHGQPVEPPKAAPAPKSRRRKAPDVPVTPAGETAAAFESAFDRALALLDGSVGGGDAVPRAQAWATIAVAEELRRLNDRSHRAQ